MTEPGKPVFVIMCGIPFAGKSTLACQIAGQGDMALLSVDATVRACDIDLGADAIRGTGWSRAIAMTFRETRRLKAGTSVVFDHANHTCRSRDRCRSLAWECDAQFAGVWVDIDPETAYARLLENRQRLARPNVPDASFRQIVEEFEPPVGEADVIRWQPDMTIHELMCRIRQAA